jgi:IS30 family transposase
VERLSDAEKARIRELAAQRLPVRMIGKDIGRAHRTVWSYLVALRRPVPPPRVRSPLRLSLAEREEISRGLAGGESLREIASRLGRAPSTVSREVTANGGRRRYRACRADERGFARRGDRSGPSWQAANGCGRWSRPSSSCAGRPSRSPVGWCGPIPTTRRCGCRTRRSTCRCSSRPGAPCAKELVRHLRSAHTTRRPLGHSSYNGQGRLRGILNISERPAEADDRAVPGHWEGDLPCGKRMAAVATLVERHSRFVMLVALPDGHRADVVADALAERITTLPEQLRRSLTWDQGPEMAAHARFTVETGVAVYFCDPRSPWQRGSNENTNGPLPRSSRLSGRSALAVSARMEARCVIGQINPCRMDVKRNQASSTCCSSSARPRTAARGPFSGRA